MPASCIWATYPSAVAADIESKPGKPGCPNESVIGLPFMSFTAAAPFAIAGLTYLAPNNPWKPLYPPGSSGSESVRAFGLPLQTLPALLAQCTAMPTKSVNAKVAEAVPELAVWDALPSFHSGDPSPNTVVRSPVGSVDVGPYTITPDACAFVSGAVRVSPVPFAPPVPCVRIVADSAFAPASIVITLPTVSPDVLRTLMLTAGGDAAAARDVGPPLNNTALLFSSTALAAGTYPTSQPARVYETHGAGAFFGVPESPFTMFGSVSTGAETGAVQYLKADVNVGMPVAGL